MKLTNNWVGYIDRSFEQIKSSLIKNLVNTNPELTDHTENNPLIILISMFAAIGELLNLYIDNMARESFIRTARKYDSMVKLTRLIDYRIKAATPTSVVVTIGIDTDDPHTLPLPLDYFFPANVRIVTNTGYEFYTRGSMVIPVGTTSWEVIADQVSLVINSTLGVTDGTANQTFGLGTNYVHDSIDITIDSVLYTRVDSWARSRSTDKHYLVDIDINGIAQVIFGDGVNGIIPPSGKNIIVNYRTTESVDIGIDDFSPTPISGLDPTTYDLSFFASNQYASSGASAYETLALIRDNAPRSLRTLDRAVTFQDFIDIAKLSPGVSKVKLDYCCGKKTTLYIGPINEGIATRGLLDTTLAYFDDNRRMITQSVLIKAAGITPVIIELDVYPEYRADGATTTNDCINALTNYGSYANQDVNSVIALSDIFSVIDNLVRVDRAELVNLRTYPYPMPCKHITPLSATIYVLDNSTEEKTWNVVYLGADKFRISINGISIGTILLHATYTDPTNTFRILIGTGNYQMGMEWNFDTHPINKTIVTTDFTIPVIKAANVRINIKENVSSHNCKTC